MNSGINLVATVLVSGAFYSFLQFLITRYDNKKGMEKMLKKEIAEVKADGKETRAELLKEISKVSGDLEEHRAVLARTHILRFADELRAGQTHSDEYFRQQILDIDTYENYCATHPDFANGLTKMASDFIKDEYRKHYLTNDTGS